MLVRSLQLCKGASDKSMVSLVVPNYESIPNIVDYLGRLSMEYKDPMYEGDFIKEAIDETGKFIKGLFFQDVDKERIGLLVYCGYIDSGSEVKKVFHTFPMPRKGMIGEASSCHEVYLGNRFKIDLLNKNEWYTEELGYI